jgi:hypothetical protein
MANTRKRRYFFGTFLGTLLWVLPTMVVMAAVGFFVARDYLSPRLLPPSAIKRDAPRPIRILSPDEAAALADDKASHVWTEGVKSSDIPKLEEEKPRRKAKPKPNAEKKPAVPAATDAAPASTTDTAPAPETSAPPASPPAGTAPDEPIYPD